VESAYARMIARVLDIEWALRPSRTSQSVSDDLVWRLVLLEAILRESAGAVRALAMEPLEWLAEYQDVSSSSMSGCQIPLVRLAG
jgi:hypothetical protein